MEPSTDRITTFDTATTGVRDAVDAVLNQAELLLPLVATAKRALDVSDFAVAKLRREDDVVGQGPLNSVGAVQQSHKGLAHALEQFNQHLLQLFDIRRELSALHPSVVDALKVGAVTQAALTAPSTATPASP